MNEDSKNPLVLFISFPWFNKDIYILIEKGIIVPTANNQYNWTRSKTSLAKYFKWISPDKTYVPGGFWAPIEYIFLIKGEPIERGSMTKLAGNNGNPLKPDKSEDFKEIMKIVKEYRKKVREREKEQKKLQNDFQSIEKIIKQAQRIGDIDIFRDAREEIKKILV